MATDDRLLTVLRSLNEMGLCTVQDVHRATGISRQAIYRIVDSLCRHGYARRIPQDSRIVLTSAVRALSGGYRDDAVIVEMGAPILEALQHEVRWPTSLATLDKDRMIVRATTRYRSPFVFDRGRVGLRLPVLHTSLGLAYLSFSPRATREIVLSLLRRSRDRWDGLARDAKATDQVLRNARQRGYAFRELGMEAKTSSIAVPILRDHEAVASVCVTYAAAALTQRQAAAELLRPLRDAAGKIAALPALEVRRGEMHQDIAS
jgi:IclR family mhp operon transcriptional activator